MAEARDNRTKDKVTKHSNSVIPRSQDEANTGSGESFMEMPVGVS